MSNEFAATGARIKALRGSLSQAEFAERLGVDRKSVTGWEAGKRLPDGVSLLRLAREFGADLNYLLVGASEARRLSAQEETLLGYFRDASPEVQRASLGALLGGSDPRATRDVHVTSHGSRGGVQIGVQMGGKVDARKGR